MAQEFALRKYELTNAVAIPLLASNVGAACFKGAWNRCLTPSVSARRVMRMMSGPDVKRFTAKRGAEADTMMTGTANQKSKR